MWATRLSGKLNGEIAPTTPIGTRITKPTLPSPAARSPSGTTSPANVRASAAANWNAPTARCASARAVRIGFAASAAIVLANSSSRSPSNRAAVSRISARFHRGSGPARRASFAVATARSTSSAVDSGTRPISEPSKGDVTTISSLLMVATILPPWQRVTCTSNGRAPSPSPTAGGASDAPRIRCGRSNRRCRSVTAISRPTSA